MCTEYFWPDRASTGRLMADLVAAIKAAQPAWEIEVLTGSRAYRGDAGSLPRRATWNGVQIHRVRTLRRGDDPLWRRAVSDIVFSLQAGWRLLRSPGDVVLVVSNPPLLPAVAALAAGLRGARTVYLIHDLYPDVPVALGMWAASGPPAVLMRRAQAAALRRASRIVVLGETMRAYLARRYGVDPSRVAVIPNWATLDGAEARTRPDPSGRFLVVYAGNLGRLHDFDTVLNAAALLRDRPEVAFVVAGQGVQAAWLRREVERRRLANVALRSFLPDGEFEALLRAASLGIVTLEPGMEPLGVPSKTYNLLAAGVPLIAVSGADSEVARLIAERQVGYLVPHGDAGAFASAVTALAAEPQRWLALSANARAAASEARVEVAAARYVREILAARTPAARVPEAS